MKILNILFQTVSSDGLNDSWLGQTIDETNLN